MRNAFFFSWKEDYRAQYMIHFFLSPPVALCFFSRPLTDLHYSVSISLSLPLMIGDDVFRINPPEPKKLIQLHFFSFQNLLSIAVYSKFIPFLCTLA